MKNKTIFFLKNPIFEKKQNKRGFMAATEGKSVRVTGETFAKLENVKTAARRNGKCLSLGVIIDDLLDFRTQLSYAKDKEGC